MVACKVFDPFWLSQQDDNVLTGMFVGDLKGFGISCFDDDFWREMKTEIANVIETAKADFSWDDLPESKLYENRLKKRRLRERLAAVYGADTSRNPDGEGEDCADADHVNADTNTANGREPTFKSWKEDPGERSRRILLWWIRMKEYRPKDFEKFWHAIRIIVLNQASSASVERVFSQLNFIVRTIGRRALEQTIRIRMMLRCNNVDALDQLNL